MNILELAIGWVTPPECVSCGLEGDVLCEACSTAEIVSYGEHCWSCGRVSSAGRTCPSCRLPGTPHSVWITTDYGGTSQKLIKSYKFRHLRTAANALSDLMVETLLDFNRPIDIADRNYLVVPIPPATNRWRQRSFDHTDLLAGKIARKINSRKLNYLARLGQSRQVGARREVRLKQAQGKYRLRLPELARRQNILLIDDVVTTGATLRAATKALRAGGARRIDALIFAKSL